MRTGLEIGRMTAGTVRLVSGIAPRNRRAATNMTVSTVQILPVVARIGHGLMNKACWQPAQGVMTKVTFITGDEMLSMLALGSYAIVTGKTAAEYRPMIDPYYRGPAIGAMAIFTGICS
jgi:hypothetical protein